MELNRITTETTFEELLNDGNVTRHRGGHQRATLPEVLAKSVRQSGDFGAFRRRLFRDDALCS